MKPTKLSPPTRCNACNSANVVYTTEAEIFSTGKRIWPYIYYCRDCKAVVGCHPGTNLPMGYMANSFIRHLRATLHDVSDPLWKSGFATRKEIYAWIAEELSIPRDFCHFSQLSISQLRIAIKLCANYTVIHAKRLKEYDYRTKPDRRSNQSRVRPK